MIKKRWAAEEMLHRDETTRRVNARPILVLWLRARSMHHSDSRGLLAPGSISCSGRVINRMAAELVDTTNVCVTGTPVVCCVLWPMFRSRPNQ
ncbi:hypothetical protein HYPSUDRAFT_289535 [Hypholoma sublateritium FD-334 SS-4]|uniref:Uncharacterized protein n=1 Tax=Hypholoma sublateritium (strain FD-334 SS-4) TaxID=945553 RepID=A0A0D2NJ02_HYPSF|nr:hypothetical protein HYPSUDRAFT_289535 [Hypholoma sublateritium FD-334 SS-4]